MEKGDGGRFDETTRAGPEAGGVCGGSGGGTWVKRANKFG